MKSRLIVVSLLAVLLLGVVAPALGGRATAAVAAAPAGPVAASVHTAPAFLDKTRFLLHMGVAFYAFHHFIYNRFKTGGFNRGSAHRVRYIAEAAIALLFTYHELKVSLNIANSSSSPLLHKLAAPLNRLTGRANAVYGKLNSGQFNAADIQSFNRDVDGVGSQARSAGYNIVDRAVTVPGL